MGSEWRERRLAELGSIVTGRTPLGSRPDDFGDFLPFLTPTDMDGRRKMGFTARSLSGEGARAMQRAIVPGGVAVSCIGWQMGKTVLVDRPALTNQQINTVVPDETQVDPLFLYYALSARRAQIFALGAGGSRTPILNKSNFGDIQLLMPPLPEQRRIGAVLGALDDKIELNRRMSQTRESMARALFKSWFVDFDPVHAKSEGRDPAVPESLDGFFPAVLSDSPVGPIPDGWRVETLGSHVTVVRGVSYSGAGLGTGEMPMHNLNSIYEGGGYKEAGIKFYAGEHRPQHVVRPGDLIVANTEQGHHRLLIGFAAIVPDRYPTGLFSHHLYRVAPLESSPLSTEFLGWLLNSEVMHDTVSGYANGTTVNMLPLAGLQRPLVCAPPAQLISAFTSLARLIRLRSEAASRTSITLTSIRDAALGKFFSTQVGKSHISEVEGVV